MLVIEAKDIVDSIPFVGDSKNLDKRMVYKLVQTLLDIIFLYDVKKMYRIVAINIFSIDGSSIR